MWRKFIEFFKLKDTPERFRVHLGRFWKHGKSHVYLSDNRIVVVVEMLDPSLKTGILQRFGSHFEGYQIIVKRVPTGYISYAKSRGLLN